MKHAFCKKCEVKVAVQYKKLVTQKDQEIGVVFCPLCGSVMNMASWVIPMEPPAGEGQEQKPSFTQRFFTMLVNVLPGNASKKVNLFMFRYLGVYVTNVPYDKCEKEVPDFVDSILNQLNKLSGLSQDKGEPNEAFMVRAIKYLSA